MKPYLDSDYSISRNLRQRHRKKGVSNEYSNYLDSENKKKGRKKCQNSAYDEYGNIRSNGLDICKYKSLLTWLLLIKHVIQATV